ncbi:sterol desaturase family protein [Vulgatibacter sp.]|uniref:sterol desaturase family protein n=1 Tax=Vulgatibacter sp. TaxID=1971226 RepID=UPI0035632D80
MYRPWAGPDSPRMFESDLLDAVSRTHFAFVPIVFVPAVAWLLWESLQHGNGIGTTAALAFAGLLAWTLAEYWLHRTLFHWIPGGTWGERFHFLVHGVHHHWPHDKYRLVLPPGASVPLFVLFTLLWTALLGDGGWAFHGGFTLGYMIYDLTHYYVHHGRPKNRWLRKLQGHHASHHFNKKFQEKRFGVSSPLWDYVFRTHA